MDLIMIGGGLAVVVVLVVVFVLKGKKSDETSEEKATPSPIKETETPQTVQEPEVTPEPAPQENRDELQVAPESDDADTKESPAFVFPSDSSQATVYRELMEETPNITPDDFIHFEGTKLLIVEDNQINQKILINVLRKSNMDITVANNGQEALDYLAEDKRFDIVLMDISMPTMDGYTATKTIREDEKFNTMPIITFTAFTVGDEIEKMFEMGANAYMTKPLNNRRLYTILNTFLKQ